MNHTKTKRLVQGAMIAGLFGVLSLLNTYTGSFFDIFICYGMVAPLVWYGYQYSLKENMIVCFVSMVVIAMVGTPFFVISSLASCLSGLVMGECLKRKVSKGFIFLGVYLVFFLNNILIYEVFNELLGMNMVSEMTLLHTEMSVIFPGISLDVFLSMIPMIMVLMPLMEMYVVVLLTQIILTRLKVPFPGKFHISNMHLSKKTGIVILVLLFGSFALVRIASLNHIAFMYIYTLCNLILAIQGLSTLCYIIILKSKPAFMILAFIGLFVFQSLYVALGILDIFSDLRQNILYNGNDEQ